MARKLCRKYGILVGISAGANVAVALKMAKKYDKVVTVLPDRGERYLSMDLFKY
jgi:cysteine synthase A